jgi:hypothetical protein
MRPKGRTIVAAASIAVAGIGAGALISNAASRSTLALEPTGQYVFACVNNTTGQIDYLEFRKPLPHQCRNSSESLWHWAAAPAVLAPSPKPTICPSPSASPSVSPTPSVSPSPSASLTPASSPSPSPSPSASASASASAPCLSASASASASASVSATPDSLYSSGLDSQAPLGSPPPTASPAAGSSPLPSASPATDSSPSPSATRQPELLVMMGYAAIGRPR